MPKEMSDKFVLISILNIIFFHHVVFFRRDSCIWLRRLQILFK